MGTFPPGFPGVLPSGGGGGGGGLAGTISVNTDFPLIADVADGDIYRVLADVTDNAGALYTNTGQSFVAGGEIIWNGTDWTELGPLLDADQVSYDNAASGLAATDVQAAIDELDADVESHSANHEVGGGDEISVAGLSGVLADAQTAAAHHTTHELAGSDAIKLDDLSTPDNNTDLDASITAHGLLPKLPDDPDYILDGTGTWTNDIFGIDKFYYKVGPTQDYATVALALAAGVARAPDGSTICFLIENVATDSDGFKIPALTLPNTHHFIFGAIGGGQAAVPLAGSLADRPNITFEGDVVLTAYNEFVPATFMATAYQNKTRTLSFVGLVVIFDGGVKIEAKFGRDVSFERCTADGLDIDLSSEGLVYPGDLALDMIRPPSLTFSNCIGNGSMGIELLNPAGVFTGTGVWAVTARNSVLPAPNITKDAAQPTLLEARLTDSMVWYCSGTVFDMYDGGTVVLTNTVLSVEAACVLFAGTNPIVIFRGTVITQKSGGAWSIGLTDFGGVSGHPTIEKYATAPSDSVFPVGTLIQDVTTGVYKQWNASAAWEYLGDQTLAHSTSHEDGGSDEISVAGLSGELADDQPPKTHATDHEPTGSDAMAVDAIAATGSLRTIGTGAQQAAAGNDARLSDDRDPTAHHTSHESGGADSIKLDDLAAPDNNTDLDATTAVHGLLSKLPNNSAMVLNGVGTWIVGGLVETLTPAVGVEIDLDTIQVKSLAIAHDVAWTLAGASGGFAKDALVYIDNTASGADRAMTWPVAWVWGSNEPDGIKDGDVGLLVVSTIGTVVTASYALLEAAPIATTQVTITDANSPYTPSPQEVILVDASGGDVTIELPKSATFPQNFPFVVTKIDASANDVIIDADTSASETINGATTHVFNTQWQSETVMPSPTANWTLS